MYTTLFVFLLCCVFTISSDGGKIGAPIRVTYPTKITGGPLAASSVGGYDDRFDRNVSTVATTTDETVYRIKRFFAIQSYIQTLENNRISIEDRAALSTRWLQEIVGSESLSETPSLVSCSSNSDNSLLPLPPVYGPKIFTLRQWQDWLAEDDH